MLSLILGASLIESEPTRFLPRTLEHSAIVRIKMIYVWTVCVSVSGCVLRSNSIPQDKKGSTRPGVHCTATAVRTEGMLRFSKRTLS